MSGKLWFALGSWDYLLLVSQDIKNTFYVWISLKKKIPCNFLDLIWVDIFIRGLLPYLSSYLQGNPNFYSQESGMQHDLCMWFYVQGENTRLAQRYSITTQLLVLYYVLSYEEALLANTKILGIWECISGKQINWKLDAKRGILTITRIHVAVRFKHSIKSLGSCNKYGIGVEIWEIKFLLQFCSPVICFPD